MKTLDIENKIFTFKYNDNAKCWMTTENINETKVDFEIYEEEYNQEVIDWTYFKEFLIFITKKDVLPALIAKSQKVLLALSDAFGSSISEHQKIEDYEMIFCGLQFKGKTDNLFITGYSYSLWFNIASKINPLEYVDPYGAFITDIEYRFITGAKRRQV